MSVGAEIKRRRKDKGITQEELARLVCVTQGAIMQYERGYKLPSLSMLYRIADAFGTTPAQILEDVTNPEART